MIKAVTNNPFTCYSGLMIEWNVLIWLNGVCWHWTWTVHHGQVCCRSDMCMEWAKSTSVINVWQKYFKLFTNS